MMRARALTPVLAAVLASCVTSTTVPAADGFPHPVMLNEARTLDGTVLPVTPEGERQPYEITTTHGFAASGGAVGNTRYSASEQDRDADDPRAVYWREASGTSEPILVQHVRCRSWFAFPLFVALERTTCRIEGTVRRVVRAADPR